jgi:hypothetical protein
VIHTYRDAEVLRSRFRGRSILQILGFGVVVVLFLFGPIAFGWVPFSWTAVGAFGAFTGLLLVGMYTGHRREQYGTCGEIRLDDDGTCELETKRRVIRLHVSEIRSVKYRRDSEGGSQHFTIYYQDGNLRVTERMTGFLDFLTRLATLNPAVDLTTFPALLADAWAGLGGPATEERAPVSRFMRNALFPLIVIGAIVYLGMQTITGK